VPAPSGHGRMSGYFHAFGARAGPSPGRHDDAMLAAKGGRTGSAKTSWVATCVLLLFAGHETTTNLIGNESWPCSGIPPSWRFSPPTAPAPSAVEELMRYDGPTQA